MVRKMTKIIKSHYHFLIIFNLSLGLFILRINHSLKAVPVFGDYDSASYFNFSLLGGLRMPLITFIYSRISDLDKIVIFQTILSFVSFLILSLSVFVLTRTKIITTFFSILILILGNTNHVVYLDSTIDSESLNISFLVLFISSVIFLLHSKRRFLAKNFFIISLVLFSGIKTMNNIISIFSILLILILNSELLIEKRKRLISSIPLILLILLNGYYFIKVDTTPELNTSGIINSRVWTVPNWKQYVLESDFPIEARSIYLRFKNENLGLPPDTAVGKLPQFQNWYSEDGKYFLLKFMATHPGYTFVGPIGLPLFSTSFSLDETIWRGAATGILDYLTYFSPNSKFLSINFIFWPLERTDAYFYLSAMLLTMSISFLLIFKNIVNLQKKFLLIFFVAISFFTGYFAWWFGSTPPDLARHQFPFAVLIRITFLISLLVIVDSLITSKKSMKFLKPRSKLS